MCSRMWEEMSHVEEGGCFFQRQERLGASDAGVRSSEQIEDGAKWRGEGPNEKEDENRQKRGSEDGKKMATKEPAVMAACWPDSLELEKREKKIE